MQQSKTITNLEKHKQKEPTKTIASTTGSQLTEFRQPLQVQSHLEMPGILVQLGHIQRT